MQPIWTSHMSQQLRERVCTRRIADNPHNAMLLRADIHSLFDDYQWGVWVCQFAPCLLHSDVVWRLNKVNLVDLFGLRSRALLPLTSSKDWTWALRLWALLLHLALNCFRTISVLVWYGMSEVLADEQLRATLLHYCNLLVDSKI